MKYFTIEDVSKYLKRMKYFTFIENISKYLTLIQNVSKYFKTVHTNSRCFKNMNVFVQVFNYIMNV
jgi:predicted RNase H-related nuclease YkuK (DUF458 family)